MMLLVDACGALTWRAPPGSWRGLLPRLVLKSLGSSLWYSVYMGARRDVGAVLLPMQAASEARAGGAPGTCAS